MIETLRARDKSSGYSANHADSTAFGLEHLTIDTSHTLISPRREVADAIVAFLAQNITRKALTPEMALLWDVAFEIDLGEFLIRGTVSEGDYQFAIHAYGRFIALCSLTIDRRQRKAKLSVKLMSKAFGAPPNVLMEVADLERCVAWTLIEHPVR
jgi:hypothetical protein